MDIKPTSQQPISDDQELAKVLAGITAGADGAVPVDLDESNAADDSQIAATAVDESQAATEIENTIATGPIIDTPVAPAPAPVVDSGLETIKNDALNELRPLVDKLNISPEEKFETYMLIIRSTDDTSLISSAFEAARAITDENIKAQALLDVVKEIEYLSNPQKQAA